MEPLPGLLAEIEAVAGAEAAMRIGAAHGGARVHIPGRSAPGHWLCDLVGGAAAAAICELFRVAEGGAYVKIPRGAQAIVRNRVRAMMAEGASNDRIARACAVDISTIQRLRARDRATRPSSQMKLL
jgi:hypothetical protein